MRLLVEGSKPGNLVKELIQDVKSEDQYFEVAVRTAGGERRAAYVVGKGPIYGSAAIQEYTGDRRLPVICAPAVMAPETPANTEQPALGGALASRGVTEVKFQQPGMPISSFSPCKYKRETTVTAENPVIVGDELKISYNFTEKGYQYSLYMLPDGSKDWVLAPGTTELQDTPDFTFKAGTQHSGNYLILIYKADKNWGCLSSAPAESLVLKVQE